MPHQVLPRITPFLAALALALCCFAHPGSAATAEEGASAAFAKFKQALVSRNGRAANRYIDDRTLDFYDRVRSAVLKMPKDRLLKQELFFQAQVLAARIRFGKAEVERADGRVMFGKLISAGAAGAPNVIETLTLSRLEATKSGASATAHVSWGGRSEAVPLRILSQGGGWKIDLTRLFEAQTQELQKQLRVTPASTQAEIQLAIERDFFPLIAQRSGKSASEKLWVPLAQTN